MYLRERERERERERSGIVGDALNLGKYVVPPKHYCYINACTVCLIDYHFSYTCTHMLPSGHMCMTFNTSRVIHNYTCMTNMVMSVLHLPIAVTN